MARRLRAGLGSEPRDAGVLRLDDGRRNAAASHSASKQTVFSLVATGFGVTLAQQSQAEASFPGVAFRKVDETNARVEFSLPGRHSPNAP